MLSNFGSEFLFIEILTRVLERSPLRLNSSRRVKTFVREFAKGDFLESLGNTALETVATCELFRVPRYFSLLVLL